VTSTIVIIIRMKGVHRMKKRFIFLTTFLILLFGTTMTVNAKPKTMPDGTVFDAEYYAKTYADVKEAFGNDEKALFNHYVQSGKAEGRLACAPDTDVLTDNFDAKYYAKNNPDVVKALGNDEKALYQHYLDHGKAEGRLPNSQAEKKTTTSSESNTNTTKNTASKGSTSVTVPKQNESSGTLVWVPTKGGTKYHNSSTCSKMKGPKHVSVETAKANGFTACKKCY